MVTSPVNRYDAIKKTSNVKMCGHLHPYVLKTLSITRPVSHYTKIIKKPIVWYNNTGLNLRCKSRKKHQNTLILRCFDTKS